jgi:hypothetical protein
VSKTGKGNGKESRNERVLHTRIPAALEDEIKKVADRLRIPVSNLVRNILQDAVSLVGTVQKNVGDRVDHIRGLAGDRLAEYARSIRPRNADSDTTVKPGAANLAEVMAWQPIKMSRATECSGCGVELTGGADARLGLGADPGARLFACPPCARKQQREARQSRLLAK